MNRILGCLLIAVSLNLPADLRATPTVGSLSASPSSITAGISTSVTITVQITDPTVIAGGVNLLQVDASGNTLSILGVMTTSGSGAFTLAVTFDPPSPGQIYLQASAAFKGILQRVKSSVLTIPVSGNVGSLAITDFNPKSGPIGTLVKISLSDFTPISGSAPQVTLSSLNGGPIAAPVSSFAANVISFVIPAGAGTGKVTVQSGTQSATSSASLSTTISSAFTLTVGPANVSLLQGQSVTYAVTVNSSNGFDGLAALTVAGAPSGLTAVFQPGAIAVGQTSILTVSAPSTQPVSTATLTFSAAATIDGQPVSKTTTAALQIVPVTTSFLGRTVVDDTQQTPIAGVTVKFLGQDGSGRSTTCSSQTTSDAAGNFALTKLPAGCIDQQLISYDGLTATSPAGKYAGVNLVYPLKPGQVTTSPVLIRLPRIDDKETVMVRQNAPTDQVFPFKSMPNLVVTVYKGTTFSLDDGSQPNPFPLVAINVPVDRLPDRMPASGVVMPFIVAFQPANAYSSQPVGVNFPNLLNMAPGGHATLMTLDPTRGFMVPYGSGTVSNDGTQVLADADPAHPGHSYGLIHFDWHGPTAPPPPDINPGPDGGGGPPPQSPQPQAPASSSGTPQETPCEFCPCPAPQKCMGADPVDLPSGIVTYTSTDLVIRGGRGSIGLVRTYRTLSSNPGPFGPGTASSYSYALNTIAAGVVTLLTPSGSQFPLSLQKDGTFANTTIPFLRGAVLTASGGTYSLRWKDGAVYQFQTLLLAEAFLTAITDPNKNTISLTLNPSQPLQITQITDPVGRSLTLTYDGSNRITSASDPIGRKVSYTYNLQGLLSTFTDAAGGVTKYTYDAQNNLATVTDPLNTVVQQNFYDYGENHGGRVAAQTEANDGNFFFSYTLQNPAVATSPVLQTVVTDPLNNETTYRFDPNGFLLSVTDATGQVRTLTRDPAHNNLVAAYTGAGSCAVCGNPAMGNVSYTFDSVGNVLTRTDALGNESSFTYDPIFNKVTSATDPLGHVSLPAKLSANRQSSTLTTRPAIFLPHQCPQPQPTSRTIWTIGYRRSAARMEYFPHTPTITPVTFYRLHILEAQESVSPLPIRMMPCGIGSSRRLTSRSR